MGFVISSIRSVAVGRLIMNIGGMVVPLLLVMVLVLVSVTLLYVLVLIMIRVLVLRCPLLILIMIPWCRGLWMIVKLIDSLWWWLVNYYVVLSGLIMPFIRLRVLLIRFLRGVNKAIHLWISVQVFCQFRSI